MGTAQNEWGNDQEMEVVSRRNDKPEEKLNTDPFLDKVDIVTIRVEA